jgi:hypothetical protein
MFQKVATDFWFAVQRLVPRGDDLRLRRSTSTRRATGHRVIPATMTARRGPGCLVGQFRPQDLRLLRLRMTGPQRHVTFPDTESGMADYAWEWGHLPIRDEPPDVASSRGTRGASCSLRYGRSDCGARLLQPREPGLAARHATRVHHRVWTGSPRSHRMATAQREASLRRRSSYSAESRRRATG